MDNIINTQLVVIGSGPGGYTAAFRAADLGLDVTLVDKNSLLGGVCLNRGCIPSKSLLHISKIINEAKHSSDIGVTFNNPEIDIETIHKWKNKIISNLNKGIDSLAKARKINIINGTAKFLSANELSIVDNQEKTISLIFDNCIIATGSKSTVIPTLNKKHPAILYSRDALNFKKVPNKLLVIGGGYIGLELATVFNSLGSKITIAEFLPSLLSMVDEDLMKPLADKFQKECENIYLSTEVTSLIPQNDNSVIVSFKQNEKEFKDVYDNVLICAGRTPNTSNLNLQKAGVQLDSKGFIPVNQQRRTLIPNIYAIGDVTGDPMLAHKASHEGKVAAEVIAGENSVYDPIAIPSVIYTSPEIAWAGSTEKELNEQSIRYTKAEFPWSANGRAMTMNSTVGKTKILTNLEKTKILGIGIVGDNAGDLISEAMLALEMNAIPEDIGMTIHPHPTLSETLANASDILTGSITELYIPKRI
jgi:dihydrolipoamide dehydrogenase